MNTPTPDWHARAAAVSIDGRCLINGRRVASTNSQTFDCTSPLNGKVLGQIARGQLADIDLAVAAARRAFNARTWAGQAPSARKKILQAFAEKMLAHCDELALLETLDMGKPIKNSLAADVPGALRVAATGAQATRARRCFLVDYQMPTHPINIEVATRVRRSPAAASARSATPST